MNEVVVSRNSTSSQTRIGASSSGNDTTAIDGVKTKWFASLTAEQKNNPEIQKISLLSNSNDPVLFSSVTRPHGVQCRNKAEAIKTLIQKNLQLLKNHKFLSREPGETMKECLALYVAARDGSTYSGSISDVGKIEAAFAEMKLPLSKESIISDIASIFSGAKPYNQVFRQNKQTNKDEPCQSRAEAIKTIIELSSSILNGHSLFRANVPSNDMLRCITLYAAAKDNIEALQVTSLDMSSALVEFNQVPLHASSATRHKWVAVAANFKLEQTLRGEWRKEKDLNPLLSAKSSSFTENMQLHAFKVAYAESGLYEELKSLDLAVKKANQQEIKLKKNGQPEAGLLKEVVKHYLAKQVILDGMVTTLEDSKIKAVTTALFKVAYDQDAACAAAAKKILTETFLETVDLTSQMKIYFNPAETKSALYEFLFQAALDRKTGDKKVELIKKALMAPTFLDDTLTEAARLINFKSGQVMILANGVHDMLSRELPEAEKFAFYDKIVLPILIKDFTKKGLTDRLKELARLKQLIRLNNYTSKLDIYSS